MASKPKKQRKGPEIQVGDRIVGADNEPVDVILRDDKAGQMLVRYVKPPWGVHPYFLLSLPLKRVWLRT